MPTDNDDTLAIISTYLSERGFRNIINAFAVINIELPHHTNDNETYSNRFIWIAHCEGRLLITNNMTYPNSSFVTPTEEHNIDLADPDSLERLVTLCHTLSSRPPIIHSNHPKTET